MPILKRVSPYADDALNLPVASVDEAVPFYESVMSFTVETHGDEPCKGVILARDGLQIGLAENGGDPSQDGCFFEVDDVAALFAEFKANGLQEDKPNFRIDQHGDTAFKVFFVIAPDGLCYCLGERQS